MRLKQDQFSFVSFIKPHADADDRVVPHLYGRKGRTPHRKKKQPGSVLAIWSLLLALSVMKLLYNAVRKATGLLSVVIVVIAAVLYYFEDPDPVKYDR